MVKLFTRRAHIRKSFYRSNGTLVPATRIPKTIVKLKTIFKGIDKPVFYGYTVKDTAIKRHKALIKDKNNNNYVSVIRRLNALRVLTKNTQPENSKVYTRDMHWLQNHR